MTRFAAARETPEWARTGSLLEGGYDFGFGWGTGGGLLGGLPSGARQIVGSILGASRSRTGTVVIAPAAPAAPPSPKPEDEDMAIDWGGLFGDVVGQAATSYFAPSPQIFSGPPALLPVGPPVVSGFGGPVQRTATPAAAVMENVCGLDGQNWGGQAPPKGYKVVNYCGQAVLRKIRRRRRRRMLSTSDKNDIASIISMAGKGQLAASLINRTSP